MFLPGREPEDAGGGNRPRPAVAGPGAAGSGRLRAGRRREGSGLTEPGEHGARDPSGARAQCGPPSPPPAPARAAEASAAPVSDPGARRAAKPGPDGGVDRKTEWQRGGAGEAAEFRVVSRRPRIGRGQSHVCGCQDLVMLERPEPFLEKSQFPDFREVVATPILNPEAAAYLFQGERKM